MNVPRGTNLRVALTVARLLEAEGLEFYSKLETSEGSLTVEGTTREWQQTPGNSYDEAVGQLEIWWSAEIEARSWGIKDITPYVKKLRLDGWFQSADENGDMQDSGVTFHYEYPEVAQGTPQIGPDPDAPTPDNVVRLAAPKWKIDYRIDPHRKKRTTFSPTAEVNLSKYTIEILF
jgi:hypothetical protein